MRTKTLLGLAVLAAGAATSMAQSNVYSLNIVGYVNVSMPAGNGIYANPLTKGTNGADEIFSYSGQTLPDGSYVNVWNGGGFTPYYYENGVSPTGWAKDSGGTGPFNAPVLPPGIGFFLNPGVAFTNTFTGDVLPAPGTTNTVTIPPGNQLLASRLPVGGSVTNAAWNFPMPDGLYVSKWNGGGFNTSYHEAGVSPTDWAADSGGSPPYTPPSFNVGEGFFYNAPSTVQWSQSLQ
jgi:hypothetical protein